MDQQKHEIADHEVYYIVLRVHAGGATWLHHGTALCDSPDGIGLCVARIKRGILSALGAAGKTTDVESIFIRNLAYCDPDIKEAMNQHGLSAQLNSLLESNVLENFVVVGKIGEDQLTVMAISAPCAEKAAEVMAKCVLAQHGKPFLPLNICLVGGMVGDLDRMFDETASQILQLLELSGTATPH